MVYKLLRVEPACGYCGGRADDDVGMIPARLRKTVPWAAGSSPAGPRARASRRGPRPSAARRARPGRPRARRRRGCGTPRSRSAAPRACAPAARPLLGRRRTDRSPRIWLCRSSSLSAARERRKHPMFLHETLPKVTAKCRNFRNGRKSLSRF